MERCYSGGKQHKGVMEMDTEQQEYAASDCAYYEALLEAAEAFKAAEAKAFSECKKGWGDNADNRRFEIVDDIMRNDMRIGGL